MTKWPQLPPRESGLTPCNLLPGRLSERGFCPEDLDDPCQFPGSTSARPWPRARARVDTGRRQGPHGVCCPGVGADFHQRAQKQQHPLALTLALGCDGQEGRECPWEMTAGRRADGWQRESKRSSSPGNHTARAKALWWEETERGVEKRLPLETRAELRRPVLDWIFPVLSDKKPNSTGVEREPLGHVTVNPKVVRACVNQACFLCLLVSASYDLRGGEELPPPGAAEALPGVPLLRERPVLRLHPSHGPQGHSRAPRAVQTPPALIPRGADETGQPQPRRRDPRTLCSARSSRVTLLQGPREGVGAPGCVSQLWGSRLG